MFQFFKRFPALFADIRSCCFVRSHVTFVVTLSDKFLATLTAVELKTAFVSGHVGAQCPFGLESLGTVVTSYLGCCIRIIFHWLRNSSRILIQKQHLFKQEVVFFFWLFPFTLFLTLFELPTCLLCVASYALVIPPHSGNMFHTEHTHSYLEPSHGSSCEL